LTERENEKIVEKIFEAWNRRDFEAFMSHFTDDVKVVWPSGRTEDAEGLRKDIAIEDLGLPDSSWRVDHIVSQGDTVCVEYTKKGTHKGTWYCYSATNKKIEYPLVSIFNFEAGKVKLWRIYFDRLSVFNQMQEQTVAEFFDKMRRK